MLVARCVGLGHVRHASSGDEPQGAMKKFFMSTPISELPWNRLWSRMENWRFARQIYRVDSGLYDAKGDICNLGMDIGAMIPQPDLVLELATGRAPQLSELWRQQIFGAALYWHLATTPTPNAREPFMLRDKDVLEVGCMRGGGARYLVEVTEPRRYVATDIDATLIERSQALPAKAALSYEVLDAGALSAAFEPASFDVVLCVQAAGAFADLRAFVESSARVLRPGGRLILVDAFQEHQVKEVLEAADTAGLHPAVLSDRTTDMRSARLCTPPHYLCFAHIVLQK